MADRRKHAIGQGSKAPVRLSCEMCRQRKVKCDKLSPCSNCQRFGATCVPVERARLPRGRSGKPSAAGERSQDVDADLEDRVAKIEQMLQNLARSNTGENPAPSNQEQLHASLSPESNSPASTGSSSRTGKHDAYVGSNLYSDLLQQTQDLRQSVNRGVETEPHVSADRPWQSLLSGSRNCENEHSGAPLVNVSIRQRLCEIYLEKVDPVFKILHRPSLSAFLIEGKPYLNYPQGDLAPATLASAVYYSSTSAMDEEECLLLFGASKETIVPKFQKESEAALARADFVTTNDLTVLQAFVLSLLAARPHDQSRRIWTMLSMAVRVGQALLLHLPDPAFPVSPFEREMRRRLWQGISFLDIEASMDRGSEPMVLKSILETHSPANVNDSDIWFGMEGPIQESQGFTDMTFTLMVFKAQCTSRTLNFPSLGENIVQSMNMRQQLVVDFQRTASTLLEKYQADGVPFHWFTRQIAECINASLQLISVRPLQRNPKFIPPKVLGDGLLQLSVNCLHKTQALRTDPRSRPWSWINNIFVPWHGLAVAIAEMSVCQDRAVMEKYWPPIEQAYERLSALVVDSQQGTFWKPIEKFMIQAQARRRELFSAPTFPSPNIPVSLSTITTTSPCPQNTPFPQTTFAPYSPMHLTAALNPSNKTDTLPQPENTSLMTMPEIANGLGPWPNVWDAMDFSDTGITPSPETSWLNYESFIGDLYENADYLLMQRYQLGYGAPQ